MKKVNLNKIEKVKRFVHIAANKVDDVVLKHDNYVVNGKSILGVFSLDLSKPVELITKDCTDFEEFLVK